MTHCLCLFLGLLSCDLSQFFLLGQRNQALLALGEYLLVLLQRFKCCQFLSVCILELLFHELSLFFGSERSVLLICENRLQVAVLLVDCKHLFLKLFILVHKTAHTVLLTHILLLDHL